MSLLNYLSFVSKLHSKYSLLDGLVKCQNHFFPPSGVYQDIAWTLFYIRVEQTGPLWGSWTPNNRVEESISAGATCHL